MKPLRSLVRVASLLAIVVLATVLAEPAVGQGDEAAANFVVNAAVAANAAVTAERMAELKLEQRREFATEDCVSFAFMLWRRLKPPTRGTPWHSTLCERSN